MEFKVLVLCLMCIAATFAVSLEADASAQHLTLADLENDSQAIALGAGENTQDVSRSKRFLLKKLALLKAGALGVGAIGLIGATAGGRGNIGASAGSVGSGPVAVQSPIAFPNPLASIPNHLANIPNPINLIGQKFGRFFPSGQQQTQQYGVQYGYQGPAAVYTPSSAQIIYGSPSPVYGSPSPVYGPPAARPYSQDPTITAAGGVDVAASVGSSVAGSISGNAIGYPAPLPQAGPYDFRPVPIQGPGKVYVVCDRDQAPPQA